MRLLLFLMFSGFAASVNAQTPCEKVKLYDQIMVKGDQPVYQMLKRFDVKRIPDSTRAKIKTEMIRLTSQAFYDQLSIRSVKLFDSAVAKGWSWTNTPITDENMDTVYYFYAVVFETTLNKIPFAFRIDFLQNGKLLDERQLAFFKKGKMKIISCAAVTDIVKKGLQPIHAIQEIYLAYNVDHQAILWSVRSTIDPQTKVIRFKDINAFTGEVITDLSSNTGGVPPPVEELKVRTGN